MTGERLRGLAMPHSHRNMSVNRENILKRYDAYGKRKLGRFFYEQSRHAQILIFLLQLHIKKYLFRTHIFNIYPSPVHENENHYFSSFISICRQLNTTRK
jgi:hypothetical protein